MGRENDGPPIELVFTADDKGDEARRKRLAEALKHSCPACAPGHADRQHLNTIEETTPPASDDPDRRVPSSWEENQAEPDEAQRRLQASNDQKWGPEGMATLRAVAGDPEEQQKWKDYAGRLTTEPKSEARHFEVEVLATCDRLARSLITGFKGSGGVHPMSECLDVMLGTDPDDGPGDVLDKAIEVLICQRMNMDRRSTVALKCEGCGFSIAACTCPPAEA